VRRDIFQKKARKEVNAKFANVPALNNKLYQCTGTGLPMGGIWRPLGIDLDKYIQEMTPLSGAGVAHMISESPLQVFSSLTNSRIVH